MKKNRTLPGSFHPVRDRYGLSLTSAFDDDFKEHFCFPNTFDLDDQGRQSLHEFAPDFVDTNDMFSDDLVGEIQF